MSLEEALAENTLAVRDLIQTLSKPACQCTQISTGQQDSQPISVDARNPEKKVARDDAPKKPKTPKTQTSKNVPVAPVTSITSPLGTESGKSAGESSPEISYNIVSKAITEKAKTDRDYVVATLANFGVKKGTELKIEQYAAFVEALR